MTEVDPDKKSMLLNTMVSCGRAASVKIMMFCRVHLRLHWLNYKKTMRICRRVS